MAMEDAWVLAKELRTQARVERAPAAYERRCRPRAEWVVQHSRAVVAGVSRPLAIRNPDLRGRGDQERRGRFRPLIVAP